jgi:hypothetical protein
VELTVKSKARLDEIVSSWKTAVQRGRFPRVRYYCSSEALPYVERAVERMRASDQVKVEPLAGAPPLTTSLMT